MRRMLILDEFADCPSFKETARMWGDFACKVIQDALPPIFPEKDDAEKETEGTKETPKVIPET